jgi:hypothetical protein
MKKIYSLFVALVACAMLFVACEPDGVSSKDKENATQLVEAHDAYYSHEYVDGVSNDFWVSFTTEDVEVPATGYEIFGTGEFVYFEVFPATVENDFPAGKFELKAEPTDGCAWAGYEYDYGAELGMEPGFYVIPQGCFAYIIEDDALVATKYMLSGYVEITGTPAEAEVFADVTYDDGSKATYYYKGKLSFMDNDIEDDTIPDNGTGELRWDYEPTTAGDYEATFDYCEMNNWGDYYGDGTDYLDMTLNSTEWYAVFGLCAPLGSGVEAYGTYTVKDGYTDWTAVPSPGGDNEYDYASFLATGMDESGAYSIAYYVASGTVVIAEDGITMDIVSHYGSKIHGEYKGTVTIADKSTPQYAPAMGNKAKVRSLKLERASVADMAYFGALKNRVHK